MSFSVKLYNLAQSVHITPGSGGAQGPGSVTFPVFLLLPLSQFQLPISQLVACTVLVLRWSLPGCGASSSELKILFSSWLFAGFVSVLGKTLALLGLSPGLRSVPRSHWRAEAVHWPLADLAWPQLISATQATQVSRPRTRSSVNTPNVKNFLFLVFLLLKASLAHPI